MSKIIKQTIPDEDIEKCFKVFNEEDDGYLTIRGLQRVFMSLGQKPSDEELKEMMSFIDPENEDGLIQYDGNDSSKISLHCYHTNSVLIWVLEDSPWKKINETKQISDIQP